VHHRRLWLQHAHYSAAARHATGLEPRFLFVVIKKKPAYDVRTYELDDNWSAEATERYELLLTELKGRLESNVWGEDGEGEIIPINQRWSVR
jgi:hypothetical protein